MIASDWLLAAEHQAGLCVFLTKMIGQQLVNANATAQLRALLKRGTGENVAGLAG